MLVRTRIQSLVEMNRARNADIRARRRSTQAQNVSQDDSTNVVALPGATRQMGPVESDTLEQLENMPRAG